MFRAAVSLFVAIALMAVFSVSAQAAACTITGTNGPDVLTGTEGADVICGRNGDDTITGLGGNDTIEGGKGVDTISGGEGLDRLYGGDEDDVINGGAGADEIYGMRGQDVIHGDEDSDYVNGGEDGDQLYGDLGDDRLFAESGNDGLFGNAGNDQINPGPGDDSVDGGTEVDLVNYYREAGPVIVNLTAGTATGAGSDTIAGVENATGTAGDDQLTGTSGPNILDGGSAGADTLHGLAGNDSLFGWGGNDTLEGGDDNDYLMGSADHDTVNGGAGTDSANGGEGNDNVNGGSEPDTVLGEGGVDNLTGGAGNDGINPGLGDDGTVDGGADTDTLFYNPSLSSLTIDLQAGTSTGGSGNDAFTSIENASGSNGDDTIFGDAGENLLSGRDGADTISGRGGLDTLYGAAGDDMLRGGLGDVDDIDGAEGTDTCGELVDEDYNCELAFNEPPILTIVDTTNTFTEGEAAKAADGTLTLTDDSAVLKNASATISSGFESGKDFLSVSGALPAGVTANYVAPTLTITGDATPAQYETMLRNVRFENTSQDPSTTTRTIAFAVSDDEYMDGNGNDVGMAVLRVNDAPVADTDSYGDGHRGVRMRTGTTHADTNETEHTGNVLEGDVDVDTPVANLTAVPGTITSADCAPAGDDCVDNVTMASNGTFTYDPPAGDDGSDTFVYTVTDNDTGDSDGTADTHTATVTVTRTGDRLWFVDDSAPAGGRGVSHAPLQSLAPLSTGGAHDSRDGAGDRIFVYTGTYTSGIALEATQKLLGEPHGLNPDGTAAKQFVAAGGSAPAISHAANSVVTLGTGNEIQDVILGNGSTSLAGTSIGTATVDDTTINNVGGRAIEITTGGTLDAAFDSVSSSGSPGVGVGLTGLAGTIALGTGTIQNASGADFLVSGGSATISYGGAVTDGDGRLVTIAGTTGGSRTFTGAITDSVVNNNGSSAVNIDGASGTNAFSGNLQLKGGIDPAVVVNNSPAGSTTLSGAQKVLTTSSGNGVTFTNSDLHTLNLTGGGLDIDTTSGEGIRAITAGTINVTGAQNTVNTTSGRALNLENTDIGASGFTFRSVGSSGGAVNGIRLDRTGDTAGLTITGDGTSASGPLSGGTIADTTGHGVSLAHTRNFNVDELSITGPNMSGVEGTEVTNFTFTDGQIVNAGDGRTDNMHASLAFNDSTGTNPADNNVDGTLTVTGNLLKDHYGGGVDVLNYSGTLSDATVSNNTIDSLADLTNSREDGVSFNLFGNSAVSANLTKAQIENNVITDHPNGHGVVVMGSQPNVTPAPTPSVGTPGNATNKVLINNNDIIGDATLKLGGAGVQVGVEGRGVGNFHVTNNSPVNNVGTHGITGGNSGSTSVDYTFANNSVTANNAELGAIGIRMANDDHIMVGGTTLGNPVTRARIQGNTVRNTTGSGMRVLQGNSASGQMHAIVNSNDIASGGAGTAPIRVENGTTNEAGMNPTMCATINSNTTVANAPTSGGHTFPGIALFKRQVPAAADPTNSFKFGIVGLNPVPSTTAQTEGFVAGVNPASNLGGNFYAGKRVTVDAGTNFYSSCVMPTF